MRTDDANAQGPASEIAFDVTPERYVGFRFTEYPDFQAKARSGYFKETTMVDYQWSVVPWYARLLGLVRLPYDLAKFVVTGRMILIPWPWRR